MMAALPLAREESHCLPQAALLDHGRQADHELAVVACFLPVAVDLDLLMRELGALLLSQPGHRPPLRSERGRSRARWSRLRRFGPSGRRRSAVVRRPTRRSVRFPAPAASALTRARE